MSRERSRESLLDFLNYLADKGLMAKSTANARRVAASKVLKILSDDEAQDVTALDLDDVMSRFQNLEGRGYKPGSLAAYRGRIRSAISDFENYIKNPLGYKPTVRRRGISKSEPSAQEERKHSQKSSSYANATPTSQPMSNSIVPIPIRRDITVYVQGLPFDLNEAEAERIANVIRAMATPV